MIQAVAGRPLGAEEALELARATDAAAAELLEPLLSLTLSPTMVSASETRNVIPHLCLRTERHDMFDVDPAVKTQISPVPLFQQDRIHVVQRQHRIENIDAALDQIRHDVHDLSMGVEIDLYVRTNVTNPGHQVPVVWLDETPEIFRSHIRRNRGTHIVADTNDIGHWPDFFERP